MFELCLLWLLLFLPAQGFLVWFPGASLLLLLRFRPANRKPHENANVSRPLRSTACYRQVSAADWTTTRSCEARCSRAAQILRIRLFQASRLLWTSPSNVRYVFDAVAFQTWLCCLSRLPFVPIACGYCRSRLLFAAIVSLSLPCLSLLRAHALH